MQIHLPDNSWKSWINRTVNRKIKVNIFLCCRWSSKSFLWSVIWIEENKESPLFERDWNDFLYSTFLQQLFNMCRFLFLLCHVCMLQKYGSQNITWSTSVQYSICLSRKSSIFQYLKLPSQTTFMIIIYFFVILCTMQNNNTFTFLKGPLLQYFP